MYTTQLHRHETGQLCSRGSYSLRSLDGRVVATVRPGRPTYVYVTHDNISEGEIDAALMDMAVHIPAPSCVIVVPCLHELMVWGRHSSSPKT